MPYAAQSDLPAPASAEAARQPASLLYGARNWKATVTSALVRGGMFLAANLHAGPLSAVHAVLAEGLAAAKGLNERGAA